MSLPLPVPNYPPQVDHFSDTPVNTSQDSVRISTKALFRGWPDCDRSRFDAMGMWRVAGLYGVLAARLSEKY